MSAVPTELSLDKLESFMGKPMVITDERYEVFGKRVAEAMKHSIGKTHVPFTRTPKALYASEIGAPCLRKLWYKFQGTPRDKPLDLATIIKFQLGFFAEELLLFLMEEAGYEVTGQQESIIFDEGMPTGWCVRGRQDAVIDGHKVDVKTASKYGMKKFASEDDLLKDDAFGYIPQLGVYSFDDKTGEYNDGYFLVANKESGAVQLMKLDGRTMEAMMPDLSLTVKVLESSTTPDRLRHAYSHRKDGERVLDFGCHYCDYKQTCFKDMGGTRSFRYATGSEHTLIDPTKIPRLTEIT